MFEAGFFYLYLKEIKLYEENSFNYSVFTFNRVCNL